MNQNFPKVSVLMPSLNVGPFIRECIQSVVDQTLQDIQIICIDAGSTDGTLEVLQEFAAKDSRITLLHSDKKSYGYQMNLGLAQAKGEYIGIVETDDIASLNQFERMYELAKANQVDLLKTDYKKFTGVGEESSCQVVHCCGNPVLYNKVVNPVEASAVVTFSPNPSSLFRTEFLRAHDIKFNETPGASYQDVGFYLQTHLLAKKILCCDEAFYWYRIDNASSSINNSGKVFMVCGEVEFAREALQKQLPAASWDECKPIFGREMFFSYMSTLRRISEDARVGFVNRFADDLKAAYARGEINRAFFGDRNWKAMLDIMLMPFEYLDGAFPQAPQSDDSPVVVSLTTYPKRIDLVYKVVDNMLMQTRRPDKVVLYLAEEEFPTHQLPENLVLRLERDPRFEVRYIANVRSHKKYFKVFQDFPDANVITVDDDIVYPLTLVRDLLVQHNRMPHAVIAARTHTISFNKDGSYAKYQEWMKTKKLLRTPSLLSLATTGGGTLFPPNSIDAAAFEMKNILEVAPSADDLWIKFHLMKAGTPVVLVEAYHKPRLELIPGTQTETLSDENVVAGRNDEIWARIQQLYPQEAEILRALMFELYKFTYPTCFTPAVGLFRRKWNGGCLCLKENGLRYTIFHTIGKVFGIGLRVMTSLERPSGYVPAPRRRRATPRKVARPNGPAVSVIIPVYNAEDYVNECLDSILSQTLKNIEVICVDDGSTDNSLNILRERSKQDPRILVVTQCNAGASAARNRGLAVAKGQFVMFADPDDCYPDNDSLWQLYHAATVRKQMAACGYLERFNPEVPEDIQRPSSYRYTPGIHLYAERPMDFGYQAYLLSRNLLVQGGITFPDVSRYQDPFFLIRALTRARTFVAVDIAAYRYRLGHQQINWAKNDYKKLRDMLSQMREIVAFAKENNLEKIVWRTKNRLTHDYVETFKGLDRSIFEFEEFQQLLSAFEEEDATQIRDALSI